MAEEILDRLRDVVDGQIVRTASSRSHSLRYKWLTCWFLQDFEGQKQVERLATVLLSVVGVRTAHPVILQRWSSPES